MARWYGPSGHPRSYDEAKQIFAERVAKTFPIGSDAATAFTEISSGGFQVAASGHDWVEFRWNRAAGPCSERYSIVVNKDAGGRVANISGRLTPICL